MFCMDNYNVTQMCGYRPIVDDFTLWIKKKHYTYAQI